MNTQQVFKKWMYLLEEIAYSIYPNTRFETHKDAQRKTDERLPDVHGLAMRWRSKYGGTRKQPDQILPNATMLKAQKTPNSISISCHLYTTAFYKPR